MRNHTSEEICHINLNLYKKIKQKLLPIPKITKTPKLDLKLKQIKYHKNLPLTFETFSFFDNVTLISLSFETLFSLDLIIIWNEM